MNKTSKVCVAATLALGTLIGVTVVENSAPTSKQAQAAITPYYTYNGYIGNNANFILDKNFINAIKYDNVKFNGIKLAKTNTIKSRNMIKLLKVFLQKETKQVNCNL